MTARSLRTKDKFQVKLVPSSPDFLKMAAVTAPWGSEAGDFAEII